MCSGALPSGGPGPAAWLADPACGVRDRGLASAPPSGDHSARVGFLTCRPLPAPLMKTRFVLLSPPPPRWLLWPDQAMCCARCSGRGGGPVAPDAVQRNGGAPLCATRDGCNHTLERPGRVFFKSFDPPPEFWPFLAFFRSYVL